MQDVGGAEHCGVQEASPDLGFIITGQCGTRNAVDDIFQMIIQMRRSGLQSNDFQPIAEIIHCWRGKSVIQRCIHCMNMLIFQFPDFNRTRVQQFAGIRDIKHVPQPGAVIRRRDQRDSLSSAPDIPMHGIVPDFIAGTGRGFGSLRINQQLIIE